MTETQIRDLPTSEQLLNEMQRVRYGRDYKKMLGSLIHLLLVVASIVVLISMLFFPVLRVTGSSMTPTLLNDELVICNKLSDFESGDIVAFYLNNKILLKRIIGTAGDVIDIKGDGTVYVNNEVLIEPYLSETALGECDIDLPYQVPESRVFVMGDHRATSVDSRSTTVGCIADEYVIGKVIVRIFPFNQIGTFDQYQ